MQQQVRDDDRGQAMNFARNVIQERMHRAHPPNGQPGLCAPKGPVRQTLSASAIRGEVKLAFALVNPGVPCGVYF